MAGLSVSRWTVFLLRVDGTLELVDHQLSASMCRERMGEAYLPDNRDHTQGSTQDTGHAVQGASPTQHCPQQLVKSYPLAALSGSDQIADTPPTPFQAARHYGEQRLEIATTMTAGNRSKMERLKN